MEASEDDLSKAWKPQQGVLDSQRSVSIWGLRFPPEGDEIEKRVIRYVRQTSPDS